LGVSFSRHSRLAPTLPDLFPFGRRANAEGVVPPSLWLYSAIVSLTLGRTIHFWEPPSLTVPILYHTLGDLSRGFCENFQTFFEPSRGIKNPSGLQAAPRQESRG
jgi:hypothetical protein